MSLFMSREGNISVFRVGLFFALIGIIFTVGAFVFANIDMARRQSPFNITPYSGAVEWHTKSTGSNSQERVFQVVGAAPEDVASYYQQRLDKHYDNSPGDPNREQCQRNPARGDFPDYVEGSGNVPYVFRCVFDNSLAGGLFTGGADQVTVVTIQPGIRNDAQETDYTGSTMIQYEQIWSG